MVEWKEVEGFEGILEISNDHRFKICANRKLCRDTRYRNYPERICDAYKYYQGGGKHKFLLILAGERFRFDYDEIVNEYFPECIKKEIINPTSEMIVKKIKSTFHVNRNDIENMLISEAKICAKILNISFDEFTNAVYDVYC